MKERILLTGKNGQLGHALMSTLAPLGELVSVGSAECDFSDTDALRNLVRSIRPRIIVNPAAYTAVDQAESEPALAHAVNAIAPGVLGEEAARIGAWVIHYSTDYVFDGRGERPYVETDSAQPLSVYGKSKRDGELALHASRAQHLTLRTSWLLGAHGGNFARTILRLAAEHESLNVVADQFGAPTSTALVADLTAQLVRQEQHEGSEDFPFGLYHLVAAGETSWHEYARFVVSEAFAAGRALRLSPENIHPIATADFALPASRPASSRLNTEKFRTTFGFPLPDWREGARQVLQQVFSDERT